jgi:GH15 family glucan-1,4-alpha-glucosidase
MSAGVPSSPHRIDGYARIRDYAAIGDGRTLALVARDGAIDWLCLPRFDDPSVFAALLDPAQGGCCALAPEAPFEVERRYLPDTNVLETTFTTAEGRVRVTDGMTLAGGAVMPWRELARRVEGLSGTVPMRWRVEPRFGYGQADVRLERRDGALVARSGPDALVVIGHETGEPLVDPDPGAAEGRFEAREGSRHVLALAGFHREPLAVPTGEEVDDRLEQTVAAWRNVARHLDYDGPWKDAVRRSALALVLLADSESGAITAAGTTSLPEALGGQRNFDYRYVWVRDSSFTLDAMVRLGMRTQAHASITWLLQAVAHTHPRIQPIYQLQGRPRLPDDELPLPGYRHSRPVKLGNPAASQLQLGNYGDFFDSLWLFVQQGNLLDPETGQRMAENADLVCEIWRNDDAGIWEISPGPYTISKIACWVALDRALKLAQAGQVPSRGVPRWRRVRDEIHDYVERECWSERRGAYAFKAGSDELDASVLLAARVGYTDPRGERMLGTIDAIQAELGDGPLLYRYSGMREQEGAFLACSFWMVEALARARRLDEAQELMGQLVGLANDVGLYSEEMDPATHEMLGNFPQGLTHLALVNAASLLAWERDGDGPGPPPSHPAR